MEHLLETLRTCVENEPRKLATAQLRQSQQDHPQAFLATTWAVVGDATQGMERRFFYATTVLSFVEESWRSNVAADLQQQYLQLYVSLVLHEQLTHEAFARKVGSVVAAMAKKQAKKTLMGELPTSVAFVWSAYTEAIAQYVKDGAASMDRLGQLLLMLHMLLRDIQTRRIGDTFEVLCRAMVAPLYSLFTLFTQLHPLEHYRTYLYLLKCSLRVFGEGAFDESFNSFLLTMSWQLAGDVRTASATATAADNTATHRLRLLEYAMKIQEKLITYFPAMLRTMHPDFFLAEPSTSEGGETCCSVLSLAVLLAEMGSAGGMSEKVVCRSMRIVTGLLSAEDGDEFVMSVAERLSRSSLLPRFMRCLIATYMPDDTSEAAVERWATEPELVAEELLIDMDDEDAAVSCAEQVFLALTGSTTCATAALAAAWDIVNVMLAEGNIPEISAALHAIGLGYYTMTEGPNSPQYLNFLETKLLPILQSSNAEGRSSPFVLRRVVWLVGMWCETVQEAHHRGAVHAALEGMLQNEQNPVVLLAALRTVENFISDNNFTLAEVPPTLATTLLHTVQRVLPALRSPTAVKELAALVHVLIEKEVLQAQGEFIVEVFAPSAVRLIETYNKPSTATESEDEEEEVNWSTLGMLIQCVQSGIKICRNDAAIWAIYHPLVLPCITPGQTVTPWAEDYAWELLLTMVRSTHTHNPMTEEALNTVLSHTQRDFSMIHLVYRTTFALLLLRNQPVEGLLTLHHVKGWLTTMTEAPVPELVSSLFALLMAVVCLTQDNNVRNCCLQQCLSCLILSNDVQSDGYMVYMAVLLRAALAHYQPPSVAVEALQSGLTAPGLTAAPLPEALVLLLDVCPDELSSRVIVLLLRYLQGSGVMAISAEDSAMIANTLAGVAISWEGAEARHPAEMTLELIGDEDVFSTSPHVERVMQRFAWLQQQSE